MYFGLFVTLFAFGTIMTLLYLEERSVVFSASMASATWTLLAFTPEMLVSDGGQVEAFAVGGSRYLLFGLALLSMLVLTLEVFGAYRGEETDSRPEVNV